MRYSARILDGTWHRGPSGPRLHLIGLQPRRPARESAPIVTDTETNYLDLDGDGSLDAVEVVETVFAVDGCTGERRAVHVDRTVSAEIGEDGRPRRVLKTSSWE